MISIPDIITVLSKDADSDWRIVARFSSPFFLFVSIPLSCRLPKSQYLLLKCWSDCS